MQTSDFLSALALCTSVGSAVYARWSGTAAQRANEIALHNERLKIYKGLQMFHMTLVTRGVGFPDEAIWHFGDHAHLSEFYFPAADYERLTEIMDAAIRVKGMHDTWTGYRDSGDARARDAATAMHAELRAVVALCKASDEKLREQLRLSRKSPNKLV